MTGGREQILAFGPFRLLRAQKRLLEGDEPVRLGSRALEILVALVERAGEVVSKNELIAYAWPNTYVEESNLRVHVAALRKILGDGHAGVRYIVNVSGRGYCFVGPVTRLQVSESEPPAPAASSSSGRRFTLPAPLARAIGRAGAVEAVCSQLAKRRLVTIVGPGGIGKSTVALTVAEKLADHYARQACFVDLAAVADPALVPAAVATAIGISVLTEDPVASLISYIRAGRMLIVLDNCEHLIAQSAHLVERVMQSAPAVDILATSREPLLTHGESLHHLAPLPAPPADAPISVEVALTFPAVQLFVERAMSSLESFELNVSNVQAVAGLCRRLDGLPLAIELAAARVDLFGVHGLAARIDDRLLLLPKGRRTAQPRHQSLRATLDWSYETLSDEERRILCRLSVFKGSFVLESAIAVATCSEIEDAQVVDGLFSLAGKSLVTTDATGQALHYRLLHTTRSYAFAILSRSNECTLVLRRHAEHFRDLLDAARSQWDSIARPEWIALHGHKIDDVRAALDWAFSASGDVRLGAQLTAASLPFGFQLALIDEFKRRAELALQSLTGVSPRQTLAECRLHVALGLLRQNTAGTEESVDSAYDRATRLAEQIGDVRYRVEPMLGRATFQIETGNYARAVQICEELGTAARAAEDPLAILVSDRVTAQACQMAGENERARLLVERVLRHPARVIPLTYNQVSIDRRVSMRIVLARVLWLQGFADRASQTAAEAVDLATSDSPFAMCQTLAMASCPVALWRGDREAARSLIDSLIDYTRRYTMDRWHRLATCYEAALAYQETPDVRVPTPISGMQRDFLASVLPSSITADAITRAASGDAGWCGPEILRVAGTRHFERAEPEGDEQAEAFFHQALALARAQNAVAWELRIALSLCRLRMRQNQRAAARVLLQPLYERFTEGFDTADLMHARAVLTELEQ